MSKESPGPLTERYGYIGRRITDEVLLQQQDSRNFAHFLQFHADDDHPKGSVDRLLGWLQKAKPLVLNEMPDGISENIYRRLEAFITSADEKTLARYIDAIHSSQTSVEYSRKEREQGIIAPISIGPVYFNFIRKAFLFGIQEMNRSSVIKK